MYWYYAADSEKKLSTKLFNFHEDGLIVMAELDENDQQVRELDTRASVECNWDTYPKFGDYLHLCREEREGHDVKSPVTEN